MKMEPIVSSETSAIRTQTPGNYPKRNKLHEFNCIIRRYNSNISIILIVSMNYTRWFKYDRD